MEMNFTAFKWIPTKPSGDGKVRQEVTVRFVGNGATMEELLKLMKEAGYEII